MKKIIFKLTIAVAALALIMTSCRTEPFDVNDPNRLDAPMPAEIRIVSSGVDSLVVLRVLSEGATDFQWRRNGTVIRPTDSILVDGVMAPVLRADNQEFAMISDGLIQNAPLILAAGLNRYGTIGIFAEIPDAFFPWTTPAPAVLTYPAIQQGQVANNVCPTSFVRLTASSPQASSFEWFRDGERIEGATERIFDVRDIASGGFQVRGINDLGIGDWSDVATILWQPCPPAWLEGPWSGRGFNTAGDGEALAWYDSISHSGEFPGDHDPQIFFTHGAFGFPGVNLSFRVTGPELVIFRSGETLITNPDGTTDRQVAIFEMNGETFFNLGAGAAPVDVSLELARDENNEPFAFRLPTNIEFQEGLATRWGIAIMRFNAAGGLQAWILQGGQRLAAFDFVYERPAENQAGTTLRVPSEVLRNIEWVESTVPFVGQVQKVSTEGFGVVVR